jgi:hypothetical protein
MRRYFYYVALRLSSTSTSTFRWDHTHPAIRKGRCIHRLVLFLQPCPCVVLKRQTSVFLWVQGECVPIDLLEFPCGPGGHDGAGLFCHQKAIARGIRNRLTVAQLGGRRHRGILAKAIPACQGACGPLQFGLESDTLGAQVGTPVAERNVWVSDKTQMVTWSGDVEDPPPRVSGLLEVFLGAAVVVEEACVHGSGGVMVLWFLQYGMKKRGGGKRGCFSRFRSCFRSCFATAFTTAAQLPTRNSFAPFHTTVIYVWGGERNCRTGCAVSSLAFAVASQLLRNYASPIAALLLLSLLYNRNCFAVAGESIFGVERELPDGVRCCFSRFRSCFATASQLCFAYRCAPASLPFVQRESIFDLERELPDGVRCCFSPFCTT